MSVHELSHLTLVDTLSASVVERLQYWAANRPNQLALLHKRRGRWVAWQWLDVLHEVERWSAALRLQEFSEKTALVLTGAFEPNLILLSLAALQAGGQVLTVAPHLTPEERLDLLRRAQPSHLFAADRDEVAHWLESAVQQECGLRLFSTQGMAQRQGAVQVAPLGDWLPERTDSVRHQHWPKDLAASWCEEGTEWADGLALLLTHWLEQGECLAFPETLTSAARDRREVVPSTLLLSAAGLKRLVRELDARLPPLGSWSRRLCDWSLNHPEHPLSQWLESRIQHVLGFKRLQAVWPGTLYSAPEFAGLRLTLSPQ